MNFDDIQITELSRTFFTRNLSVVIPAELVEERVALEIQDVKRVYKRPGFRIGFCPEDIIRRHLGAAIRTRMIDRLVEVATARSLKGLCLMQEPDVEVLSISGDVEMTVNCRVRPELPQPCGMKGLRFSAALGAYYSGMEPLDTEAISDFCSRTLAEIDRYYAQQRAAA